MRLLTDVTRILWLSIAYIFRIFGCSPSRKLLTTNNTAVGNGTNDGTNVSSVIAMEPEKSIWDKIEAFYEDKNNFAMYLVLPVIVLVYGGCSAIYCVAKCRHYCKKGKERNMKKLIEEDDDDDVNADSPDDVFSSRTETTRASSSSRNRNADTDTPLPWQITEDPPNVESKQGKEQSPPPPYEVYRKGSVEEVIALSGPQKPAYPYNQGTPVSKNGQRGINTYQMAKQILRIDDEYPVRSGRKKRLVFTTD